MHLLSELHKSFSLRDYNKEGVVYAQDVPSVIRSVHGLKPSEDEIQSIVSEVNKAGILLLSVYSPFSQVKLNME